MHHRIPDRRVFRLSLIAFVLLAAAGVRAGEKAPAQKDDLWIKGSDQVLAGAFDEALSTFQKAQRSQPNQAAVKDALAWMLETKSLRDSREDLRKKCYASQCEQTKKRLDKGEIDKALYHCWQAYLNSPVDEQASFTDLDWVGSVVDAAKKEAEKHRKENKWRDALEIYEFLKVLYPKDKQFKAEAKVCRQRAHFEVIYGPKSTWKTDLRGVRTESVPEIVSRIAEDYVRAPDFKKLGQAAVENLLILAETPSLKDMFPSLGDQDRVKSFTTRLRTLLDKRVKAESDFDERDLRSLFRRVRTANDESLQLPDAVLVDEFVAGMLDPLDEFTSVIWPSEVEEFNKHTRGEFPGVGIQITKQDAGYLRVESPLEDSPAYRAGIQPGDLITAVDGKSTMEMTINQAVNIITGEPGSTVTLTLMNPETKESRPIPLKRERIKIRTVRGERRDESKPTGWDYMIDKETGVCYVRVSAFMEKTVEDLEAALKQMKQDGCKGLILDLRFNPGGLLTSARDMCYLFLRPNDPITKTLGRSRRQEVEFRVKPTKNAYGDVPLIVLVNGYSASASEIVAGALAGLKEACIIGERSYGKGSVQNLIPIEDNDAYLKLTTARYYVPDRDAKDGWYLLNREEDSEAWGVEPHIKVAVIPQETRKILRLRRERDLLRGKDQKELPKDVLNRTPSTQDAEEDPDPDQVDTAENVDPQIAAALNVMRIKLLSKQPWALAPREQRTLTKANAPKDAG